MQVKQKWDLIGQRWFLEFRNIHNHEFFECRFLIESIISTMKNNLNSEKVHKVTFLLYNFLCSTMSKLQSFLSKHIQWLSLRWEPNFLRSMVIVIGVVFVWRGLWNLMDMYLLPDDFLLSNIVWIGLGIFLLYLIDGDLDNLGHHKHRNPKP